MSDFTIYHNPCCSKSRQTLALLKEKGIEPTIVEYLNEPLSFEQLQTIASLLGKHPTEWIRTGEKVFKELGLNKKDQRTSDQWLKILVEHPILIERPIVTTSGKAVLGRPPENVLEII